MSTNSNDPITYVAGFLFDEDFKKVLLILKQKPDWQRGATLASCVWGAHFAYQRMKVNYWRYYSTKD